MKKVILCGVIVVLFPLFVFAELTLKEAKEFLTDIKEIYSPPDEEFNRRMEQAAADYPDSAHMFTPSKGFYYPAVNIYPLWQKAGITPEPVREGSERYLFGYDHKDEFYLRYPATKLFQEKDYTVMRINSSTSAGPGASDYQYLFFRRKDDQWIYFDNLIAPDERHSVPELVFLNNSLFYLSRHAGSGTGVSRRDYQLFNIKDYQVNELPSFLKRAHVSGWGMIFDRRLNSKVTYADNQITIEYLIEVSANRLYLYEYDVKENKAFNLFTTTKKMVFDYDGSVLQLNKEESQLTLEELESLFTAAEKGFYLIFKPEFDALASGNASQKEWFNIFRMRNIFE